MVSRSERIILAAVISFTSFCFSFYWYKYGRKESSQRNKSEPIAVLEQANSNVQRKPVRRVIWQEISKGDLLFNKEAIRTPSDASAEIIFLDGKTKIELEPDSVIVLEKTTGDVALNFLKGNVFVSGESSGLKIKSGNNIVEAGSGEINLSKKQGDDLELQVLKGQAKLNANGKTIDLEKNQIGKLSGDGVEVEKDLIVVQKPLSNSKVYIDYRKKQKFEISWNQLAEDYDVEMYAGRKSDQLRLSKTAVIKKEKNQLTVKLKPGFIYWQLRAKSKNPEMKDLKSAVFKNKVIALQQPAFVEPQTGQKISLKPNASQFEFRWTDPMAMEQAKLQIWKTQKGQMVQGSTKTFDVTEKRHVYTFESSGDYSARLTGFLSAGAGQFIPTSSEILNFQVNVTKELQPPLLRAPLDGQKIRYTRARETGLLLSWDTVAGAEKYILKYQNSKDKEEKTLELKENIFKVENFVPGIYSWRVATKEKSGKQSKFSETRKFLITDMPALAWGEETNKGLSYYIGQKPQLRLAWQRDFDEAVRYRLKFSLQGEWGKAQEKVVSEENAEEIVAEDGFYEVQVQALDKNKEVIAQTTLKTVNVKLRPQLISPEFDPSLSARLDASSKGDIKLFWESVSGAKEYLIRLHRKDWEEGKFEDIRSKDIETTLKSLKPGTYRAKLFAVDSFERLSRGYDERTIRVSNKSDIRAPSAIRKIKVKGVYRKGK